MKFKKLVYIASLIGSLGLILLLTLTGCCRKTAAPPSVSVHEKQDSIREVIVERVVHVHDSVPVLIPVEKIINVLPDIDTSTLETSMAVSTAFIDSMGFLHHSLDNKARTIFAPVDLDVAVADTSREEYHNEVSADTVYLSVPAQLSKGQKFLIKAGWLTVLAFFFGLAYLAYRVCRKD